MRVGISLAFILINFTLFGQSFEIAPIPEHQKCLVGQTLKIPVELYNQHHETLYLVVKRTASEMGTSQKSYFCLGNHCYPEGLEEILVKIEPGQTLKSLHLAYEGGLMPSQSSAHFLVYNKAVPGDFYEFEIQLSVEDKPAKENIYSSSYISLQDVYPNPVSDQAYVEYKILKDGIKAKIVVFNILGNPLSEIDLPSSETRIKIQTEQFSAGIYFYTLFVEEEGVMTHKLIVKR